MLIVGLTGNIGSGKSTVCDIFSALGIPVYQADSASKKFLDRPSVLSEAVALFGQKILSESGAINKRALASVVFNDPGALASLNAILHPLVKEDARIWSTQHQDKPYVIHEAAIIFESGFRGEYNRVIYVTCPVETAVGRVMKRDGASREDILRRLRFQWDDERKIKLSSYIINNDGLTFLIPQVLKIHKTLMTPPLHPSP
jgi:dephospho-CoA kinase